MKYQLAASVLLIFVFIKNLEGIETNPKLVHVFFRHGSRTPEAKNKYALDPHKVDDFEPPSWGQLTNIGKQMAYKLGHILRQRYNSISDIYNPEIVRATSTDFDRTKETLLMVLAGLFPPSSHQIWNSSFPWMPIPYHYDKDKYDYSLKRPNAYCPKYVKELKQILSSEAAQLYNKQHHDLFKYIKKHSGNSIENPKDVFGIYQTLNAEEKMNLALPEWTESVFPTKIHEVAAQQCHFENYNSVLKRLNGGRMLGKVINNMVKKSTNDLSTEKTKIFLYSGHENNVLNILAALNLYQPHVPKYCAAVIIELHYNNTANGYGVMVHYLKSVDSKPEVQKLEGCDTLCPLNEFIQITTPHIPVNYTAECDSHINLD